MKWLTVFLATTRVTGEDTTQISGLHDIQFLQTSGTFQPKKALATGIILGREWELSVDIKLDPAVRSQSEIKSIFQFTQEGKEYGAGKPFVVGNRIPAVWVYPDTRLHTAFSTNDQPQQHFDSEPMGTDWFNLKMQQRRASDGNFFYEIFINNQVVESEINTSPTVFDNVTAAFSSMENGSWQEPADAQYKNLSLKSSKQGCSVDDIFVKCSPGQFDLNVPKCFLDDQNVDATTTFIGTESGDDQCHGTLENGDYQYSFANDECGVETTSNDTYITYTGKLRNSPSMGVSRQANRFELDVTCKFAKQVGVNLHDFFIPIYTSNLVEVDSVVGEFEVDMSLFTDAEMTQAMNQGHKVTIPEPIHAKLTLKDVDNLVVKIRNCWATPSADKDDTNSYLFIQDFSVLTSEGDDVAITENCISDEAAFSINSFSFGDQSEVYLHCEVDLCNKTIEECQCKANARKRRSVDGPADATIKVGPITLGK